MKLENTTPKRRDLTITFTPEEQDHLRAIVGSVGGASPIRETTDALYGILVENGAEGTYLYHISDNLYVEEPNK